MVYWKIKDRNKPFLAYKEPWIQESEIKKFRTIVSEVSSCVGIPIYMFYCSVLNESNMQIKEQEINKKT